MTLHFPQGWNNFDVQALSLNGNNQLAYFAYDQPFAFRDGEVVPYAGELVDNTETEVSFTLRDGITCSDGHVMTATDAAASLRRTVESTSAGVYFGAGPFEVTADDSARLVTLKTETPHSVLAYSLSQPISSLVCPSGLDAVESDPKYLETHYAGSGPYEMVSSVAGSSVDFKLRPDWAWGPDGRSAKDGLPGEVTVLATTNMTTVANSLLTETSTAGSVTGPDVARLNEEASLNHAVDPTTFHALVYNYRPGHPTVDLVLRKALGAAVTRADYIQAEANGDGTTFMGAFPPSDPCYDDSHQFTLDGDIDQAKKLLTDGGYTYSGDDLMKDGEQVTLQVLTTTAYNGAGEYLQAEYEKLGIEVDLQNLEFNTFLQNAIAGTYDVYTDPSPLKTPDPSGWAGYVYGKPSPEGANFSGHTGAAWDNLWESALAASPDSACAEWSKVQAAVIDEEAYTPMGLINQNFYANGYTYKTQYFYILPQYLTKE